MKREPVITVLFGGVGPEREISLVSGRSLLTALEGQFPLRGVELTTAELPAGLNPEETVVFPALHGEFGEDGQIQALLEARECAYAGCDSAASRLCIHKIRTKRAAGAAGVPVADDVAFTAEEPPSAGEVVDRLGPDLVIKPVDQGSSVGLRLVSGEEELAAALAEIAARPGRAEAASGRAGPGAKEPGGWMIERRIRGREVSIGLLGGRGLGVVELRPQGGVYDYTAKYTAGATEYLYPAPLPGAVEERVRACAEAAWRACGCRDFARADFLLDGENQPWLLEINTLPGLTPTSLLPKSASCCGYSFPALARALVEPARERFWKRMSGEATHG